MKQVFYTLSIACAILSSVAAHSQNAKLIVYREGSPYGLLAHYKVNVDGKEVSSLGNKSYYTMDITPGQHTIAPKQDKRAITLNAQAGQTYVVKYQTMIGILGARPRLKVQTLDEAKADSKYLTGELAANKM